MHKQTSAISIPPRFSKSIAAAILLSGLTVLVPQSGASPRPQQDGSPTTQSPAAAGQPGTVVPRLIRYSGTVKDGASNVQTGATGLTFALYEFQEGGAPLWVETQTVDLDEKGHYTVLLGTTQAEGLPLDLFTSGTARWLGVTPQLSGIGEQPRVLLVGVPYALKAADADTLGGKPASAFVTTQAGSSSTDAGTQAVPQSSRNGAISAITGNGTTNFVPIWTSSTNLGNSTISEVGGRVHVTGSLNVTGNVSGANLSTGNTVSGAIGSFSGPVFAGQFSANNSNSSSPDAVFGNSTTGFGVHGQSSKDANFQAGIFGAEFGSTKVTLGVFGFTKSPIGAGVYGRTVNPSITGAQIFPLAGVWGDTNQRGIGVLGTVDDGNALSGVNSSAVSATLALDNDEVANSSAPVLHTFSPRFNGSCAIDVSGNLACTGSKSAVVPVDNGSRKVALYAVEAPENWFEDFGSGTLAGGAATVALERTFAQTVNAATEYHVFLTPKGDCKGLYVANETPAGFEVHELGGGRSTAAFDYRIVARRKGYEDVRLADKTKQFQKPDSVRKTAD